MTKSKIFSLSGARALAVVATLVMAGAPAFAQTTPGSGGASPSTAAPATPAVPAPASPPVAEPNVIPAPDGRSPGDASTARPVELAPRAAAVFSGKAEWDTGYQNLQEAFVKIRAEMGKAGLQPGGRPLAVFVETDDQGFKYDAMIPLLDAAAAKRDLGNGVRVAESPAGKTMKFEHRGAYEEIDSTYEAVTAYLDEKGLEARNFFIEEYLNDPKGADDTNMQVDIYVFLK